MSTHQPPVSGRVKSRDDMYRIVTHPAFRIGFLDAQRGAPLEHDAIIQRIQSETPVTALKRVGWDWLAWTKPTHQDVAMAQYRYEEGRFAVLVWGLKCRGWNHPDFPPAQVRKKIDDLSAEITGNAHAQ